MFSVGQKIVCVDDVFHASIVEWADCVPIDGHVYTIREISRAKNVVSHVTELCFHLLEINNPKTVGGREVFFSAWRFAPEYYLEAANRNRKAGEETIANLQEW